MNLALLKTCIIQLKYENLHYSGRMSLNINKQANKLKLRGNLHMFKIFEFSVSAGGSGLKKVTFSSQLLLK